MKSDDGKRILGIKYGLFNRNLQVFVEDEPYLRFESWKRAIKFTSD